MYYFLLFCIHFGFISVESSAVAFLLFLYKYCFASYVNFVYPSIFYLLCLLFKATLRDIVGCMLLYHNSCEFDTKMCSKCSAKSPQCYFCSELKNAHILKGPNVVKATFLWKRAGVSKVVRSFNKCLYFTVHRVKRCAVWL